MTQKMLVVDDEEILLFAMADYFSTKGYEVDCAQEVDEARRLMSSARYSVAIVDLRLSGLDSNEGLEIVEFGRVHCPWMRIVVLTAFGSAEVEGEARRRGADAFICKPKPLPELERTVAGLCCREQALEA